jgi:hypothetical protein
MGRLDVVALGQGADTAAAAAGRQETSGAIGGHTSSHTGGQPGGHTGGQPSGHTGGRPRRLTKPGRSGAHVNFFVHK